MSGAYLNALPLALIAVNKNNLIEFINQAAEIWFETSAAQVMEQNLSTLLTLTEEEQALLKRVFTDSEEISLYERMVELPKGLTEMVMHITPVDGPTGVKQALFTFEKSGGLQNQAASERKKETTQAAGIMAAMLAHEVKNPLSGIRGAAQFLKDEVSEEHRPLTDLICMETDRISGLLDQMEIFTAGAPADIRPVNIHEVLQYVISIAVTGFAKHVRIKELYDPSLPEVLGHRDLLVQLFLNLVKNATEAMQDQKDAVLTITTAYRSGYRIRSEHGDAPVALPVIVSIEDNGPGVEESMRGRLFEPFASAKEEGRGLGLAVVAKIASDLGLIVELDEHGDKGAKFNVMLACA